MRLIVRYELNFAAVGLFVGAVLRDQVLLLNLVRPGLLTVLNRVFLLNVDLGH